MRNHISLCVCVHCVWACLCNNKRYSKGIDQHVCGSSSSLETGLQHARNPSHCIAPVATRSLWRKHPRHSCGAPWDQWDRRNMVRLDGWNSLNLYKSWDQPSQLEITGAGFPSLAMIIPWKIHLKSICIHTYISIYLFMYWYIYVYIYLFIHLFIHLYVYTKKIKAIKMTWNFYKPMADHPKSITAPLHHRIWQRWRAAQQRQGMTPGDGLTMPRNPLWLMNPPRYFCALVFTYLYTFFSYVYSSIYLVVVDCFIHWCVSIILNLYNVGLLKDEAARNVRNHYRFYGHESCFQPDDFFPHHPAPQYDCTLYFFMYVANWWNQVWIILGYPWWCCKLSEGSGIQGQVQRQENRKDNWYLNRLK